MRKSLEESFAYVRSRLLLSFEILGSVLKWMLENIGGLRQIFLLYHLFVFVGCSNVAMLLGTAV
jgi:hypothetical protein